MPKYWGGNYFEHGSFSEVGQKQKTEKKEEEERLNDGDNNGQVTHGARKHAWRTQAAWANFHAREISRSGSKAEEGEKREKEERTMVITMAKLRMVHAWRTHGARMAHASHLG